MEEFVEKILKKTIQISARITPGWSILAKRWIVERTFAWLGRHRRMSKDYELLAEVSTVMIYAVMVRLMLERLDSLQTL
jgi:putative transposase